MVDLNMEEYRTCKGVEKYRGALVDKCALRKKALQKS
jgi:hypothetical protein